jgi:electron transfer flavoprotein beta subunit
VFQLKIIVCIKQVPATSSVEIDPTTGVLKREGVESKMNPYDLYALETALRLKEKTEGSITTVTMGPPQAQSVIEESFILGADQGYLFSDRKFAGSDVLATAYTLSQGIGLLGEFDLIVCGKQTTDGDTAQVGPELAEFLGIPHVTWVREITEVTADKIVVKQDLGNSYAILELPYPSLLTVEKDIFQPRLPSYRRKLLTAGQQVKVFTFSDFIDHNEQKYGLNGSATQVERIFPPLTKQDQTCWEEPAPVVAEKIYELIKDRNFI